MLSTVAVVAITGQTVQPLQLLHDRAEADAVADELRRCGHRIEVRSFDEVTVAPNICGTGV
jgi:hypothetical protein